MQLSLMVEGQEGLTWARWKELVARVEDWGWAGFYRSDHFTMTSPPSENSLETIVSLTYLADHTTRVDFGPLVAPLSFRDPVMLARQAAHLNDLSGGRMILGVGAGWSTTEHEMFGYPLLDKRARMERFTEGVQVVWQLLKGKGPQNFEGRWYTLKNAEILPRPANNRILVGGNGLRRTLPLAARFADVWNGVQLTPARFRELAAQLDRYVYDAGRKPDAVKKTAATFLFFGSDQAALDRWLARFRTQPWFRDLSNAEIMSKLRADNGSIIGLAEDVIPQIRAFADAGVQELMLQIFDSDDIQGLDAFARTVMPAFAGESVS